ncbi:MAG: hypothetical protein ACREH4_00590 [Vitreimonas sp.]
MQSHALLFAALFALGACASARTLSYPASRPDADVMVGQQRYQVWFHDTDSTVLIQRGEPRPLGQLLARNIALYALDRPPAEPVWRAAANAVLRQIDCEVTQLHGADRLREAAYECVPGVDVTEAIALNRDRWRQGVRVDAPAV